VYFITLFLPRKSKSIVDVLLKMSVLTEEDPTQSAQNVASLPPSLLIKTVQIQELCKLKL
jgi:hypothetical protein